jgi:hypothetical protein
LQSAGVEQALIWPLMVKVTSPPWSYAVGTFPDSRLPPRAQESSSDQQQGAAQAQRHLGYTHPPTEECARGESTVRYLGIEVDDALEIAEQIEI